MAEIAEIEVIKSPNWESAKEEPRVIRHIVIHDIEGTINGAISRFLNADQNQPGGRASCYRLIGRAGRLVEMVPKDLIAWHAGTWPGVNKIGIWGPENDNWHSVCLEVEGYAHNRQGYTDVQYEILVSQCKELIAKDNIPIDRSHIVSHSQIATDRSDPGPDFKWDWFMAQLQGLPASDVAILNGHGLGGGFLAYFKAHGGVDVLGFPESEEFQFEGRTTQIFERAVLQFFPENAGTPYTVQGMLVGDFWGKANKLI